MFNETRINWWSNLLNYLYFHYQKTVIIKLDSSNYFVLYVYNKNNFLIFRLGNLLAVADKTELKLKNTIIDIDIKLIILKDSLNVMYTIHIIIIKIY